MRIVYYQEYDVCGQLLYRHNEDNYGNIRHETGKNVIYIHNLMIISCKRNNSEIWESHSGEYMDYRFTDVTPCNQVDR